MDYIYVNGVYYTAANACERISVKDKVISQEPFHPGKFVRRIKMDTIVSYGGYKTAANFVLRITPINLTKYFNNDSADLYIVVVYVFSQITIRTQTHLSRTRLCHFPDNKITFLNIEKNHKKLGQRF